MKKIIYSLIGFNTLGIILSGFAFTSLNYNIFTLNALRNAVGNILLFIYFLCFISILWGIFLIIKAKGKKEQVIEGKNIIIISIIGLVIIWLYSSVLQFLLQSVIGA